MNIPLNDLHLKTITFLLQTGQKEHAIKYYADATNATSFQAKDAINGLEQALLIQNGIKTEFTDPSESVQTEEFQWAEIDSQIQQEQLIQAIKTYRELTGVDLKTAKEAVENRRSIHFSTSSRSTSSTLNIQISNPENVWDIVDECLRANKKIEAIKVYRQIMNVDLKEAKDRVEERAKSVKPVPNSKTSSQKVPSSGKDKLRVLLYWLIILIICYYLMSNFIHSITLVSIIRFFIQTFSF